MCDVLRGLEAVLGAPLCLSIQVSLTPDWRSICSSVPMRDCRAAPAVQHVAEDMHDVRAELVGHFVVAIHVRDIAVQARLPF